MLTRMNIKHTVIVEGKTFTRKSARVYTHAVIGRWLRETSEQRATSDEAKKHFLSDGNYGYYANGGWRKYESRSSAEQNAKDAAVEAEYKALGPEGAWAKQVESSLAFIEARAQKGDFQMAVLGWSQSKINAEKMAASYRSKGYADVSAIECNRADK